MDVILMIDTSGSMRGHKIAAVNDALENLIDSLIEFSNTRESVNIAVELFSKDVRWLNQSFQSVDKFSWTEPLCTGMTSMGAACISLAEFFKHNVTQDKTKILIMSDGCPTDDYDEGLHHLYDLTLFKSADRCAIALGEEADTFALSQFTGDSNKVFKVTEIDKLLDTLLYSLLPISTSPINNSPIESKAHSGCDVEEDEWD